MTRNDFAKALLDALKLNHCDHNAWALVAWMQAEGGHAAFNPLNTTQRMPGSTDYNDLPGDIAVQNYKDAADGVEATRKTISQTTAEFGYVEIVSALRRCAPAARTLRAVEASDWGTGGLASQCLPEVRANYWHFANVQVAGE